MKEIKISAIIYVLNSISYIEKCVRSVMSQTLQEIEILIIDGGSTDGTLEIIEKLSKEDIRIRIIHSASGVGRQFNKGLCEARGEYISICESDDYILPDMYKYQYEIAKKYELDVLRADANHFFEIRDGKEFFIPVTLTKQEEMYDRILDTTDSQCVLKLGINSFWSGLYRRRFLVERRIFMNETEGAAYQDTAFYFLAIMQAKRVMLSQKAFYCYRLDNPSSSVNNPQRITMLTEEYRLLKKRLKDLNLFEKCKGIYLSWKVNGHLGFYNSLPEELRDQYIIFMYQDLYRELSIENAQENEADMPDDKILNLVKESVDALREYLYERYRILYDTEERLEKIERNKEVVIFGSGDIGKLVCSYLMHTNRNVVAYTDNNKYLWGKPIGSIIVLEPEKAARFYPDSFYIIANEKNSDFMKKQLQQFYIKEDHIIICNNYCFFLKHILQKKLKGIEGPLK